MPVEICEPHSCRNCRHGVVDVPPGAEQTLALITCAAHAGNANLINWPFRSTNCRYWEHQHMLINIAGRMLRRHTEIFYAALRHTLDKRRADAQAQG